MAGLQRSAVSFRRQGSSGLIWDDKLLSGELNQLANNRKEDDTTNTKAEQDPEQDQQVVEEAKPSSRTIGSIERSRSNGGGRAFRTGKVSPAIEPPSPKMSACGFCSAFGKHEKTHRRPKFGKRRT